MGDALAAGGATWASDDDPELVEAALPFALKTMESLLAEAPEHRGLLLAACSGFTQYAYAFVETEVLLVEEENYEEAQRLRERALRLYLRARGYCLRSLELVSPGVGQGLAREPQLALDAFAADDVPLLYWTGASWGAALSVGRTRPDLLADLPAVRALFARALALDGAWQGGVIHEALIALEALPPFMGGSPERARAHFEEALELSGGRRANPYVAFAESVAVPAQDRREFERLLAAALAIDPDAAPAERLANLIAQRRARILLERGEDLFLEATPSAAEEETP